MDDGVRVYVDDGRVHAYLKIIEDFSQETGMRLNRSKTAALSFSFGQAHVSLGGLQFPGGERIEVLDETKLLGVTLDNQLTLDCHVGKRKAAAMCALWSIQRLKNQGVMTEHLRFAYEAFVRSVLEYSIVPLYPMLNKGQLETLESVQHIATRVLLNYKHTPYSDRLATLGLQELKDRWKFQFEKLSLKSEHHPCLRSHFIQNKTVHTMKMRHQRPYEFPICRTERYRNSPVNQAIVNVNKYYEQLSASLP